jgi:hypothetical protein
MKYLVRLGRGGFGGHKQTSFLALLSKARRILCLDSFCNPKIQNLIEKLNYE